MEKYTVIVVLALVVLITATGCDAGECCSAYTDFQGVYHDTMLCQDYCCFDISASLADGFNAKKTCCDNILREVPQDQRQDDCVNDWIQQHIWVPIVSGIVVLILLIACCTCCCCGCCGGCGRNQGGGVIVMPNGHQPQSTVIMSSQMSSQMSGQMTNPAHQGYDQK